MSDGIAPLPTYKKGLRSRLMVFTALSVLLPTLVTGTLVVMTFHRALVNLSLGEQTETCRRMAERVAGSFDGVRKLMLTLASQGNQTEPAAKAALKTVPKPPRARVKRPGMPPAPPPPAVPATPPPPTEVRNRGLEASLKELLRNYPAVMEASVTDPDGKEKIKAVRLRGRIVLSKDLANRADREEVKRALTGKSMVGSVFFTVKERFPQVFLSVPLARAGGAMLARLSLDNLSDLVVDAPGGQGGKAWVVDKDGTLLAHADRNRVLAHENRSQDPVVQDFIAEGSQFVDGGRVVRAPNGGQLLVAAHRVPGVPWLVVVQTPMSAAMQPLLEVGRRAGMGAAAAGLVFLLAGLWLAYRILKPLRLLQEGVHKIGEGDLSQRIKIRTGDEIQKVADEFNTMADSLEKLEETKRDLTHMIVHDLKSPLSSILGSLDYVLMASKEVTPDHRKLLTLGSKAGKDLLRMIQNLLDLGKMEEGKLELRRESFPLLDLAAQCVDDLEANMHREGKMVSVEIPKDLPKVWADRDLLHRVLSNLLTNALKHTTKGAEIAIRAESPAGENAIVLSVKDTGEGIPQEYLGKIFEKFGQADMRRQNFRVGSGLGLTFCKLAVESHGGAIWVESEVGRGSEFFVKLPLPSAGETAETPMFPTGKLTGPGK